MESLKQEYLRKTAKLKRGVYILKNNKVKKDLVFCVDRIMTLQPYDVKSNIFYNNYLYSGEFTNTKGITMKMNRIYISKTIEKSLIYLGTMKKKGK